MSDYLKLKYIDVKQPIGTFYITKMNWSELFNIAEADIRRIEEENSNTKSFDSYLGIQREVSEKRVKEIAQYVRTIDATFPTSVILSIESKTFFYKNKIINPYDFDLLKKDIDINEVDNIYIDEEGLLNIRKSIAVASILDGQHRIEGLRKALKQKDLLNNNEDEFELNVTIFVDLDIDDQAQIFSVINKAQTKVNKSLVYDLYDYAKSRSPQKSSHDIVRLLNSNDESPFYRKVKILGKAVDKDKETIAQATFVDLIINYTSRAPMQDRDVLKRKKKIKNTLDSTRFIFREYFLNNNDEYILYILWNYFEAVSLRWPYSWSTNEKGNILNKSTGIVALFRFLKDIYEYFNYNYDTTAEDYLTILNKVNIKDNCFSPEIYLPGSSGQSKLYKELKESLN